MNHQPPVGTSWGKKFGLATVLALVTLAGLSAYGDAEQVADQLRHFHVGAFGVALVLSLGNYLLRALRFHYYLRAVRVALPIGETVLVSLAGLTMTITPGKLGEVFKSFLLKWTHDTPIAVTSPTVIAERATDLVALLMLSAWGALLLPSGGIIAVLCVVLALTVVGVTTFRPLGHLLLRLATKVPFLRDKGPRLTMAYDALSTMMKPAPLVGGTLLALLAWFLQVVALLVIVQGLPGADISLQASSLCYCAPLVAGVVMFLPGGLGVTEIGMTGLLSLGGDWATPAASAMVTILVRLATLWFSVLVGALALALHRRLTGWTMSRLDERAAGA